MASGIDIANRARAEMNEIGADAVTITSTRIGIVTTLTTSDTTFGGARHLLPMWYEPVG